MNVKFQIIFPLYITSDKEIFTFQNQPLRPIFQKTILKKSQKLHKASYI